jgi:hypothetical protein
MTFDSHDDQSRLQQVIADYLAAADAGKPVDREELLTEHPALAEELREFFASHDELGQLIAPTIKVSPAPAKPAVGRDAVTLAPINQVTAGVNGRPSPARPPKEIVGYFGDYELLE